jgi:putative ABC transport system permease protein
MGMSMREVISMLIWEQILITGSSIGLGVVIGALVTRLYLPLIQLAYSDADQILPMRMITNWSDSVRLFGVIALVVVVCMVILAWLVSRIRIAQALKLGED